MRKICLLLSLFIVINVNAQNYLISFAGTGGSSTVGTVKVENLTTGTTVTINGGDVLRLTSPTSINRVGSAEPSDIKIYPNPMTEYSYVQFSPETDGDVTVSVLDITGKVLANSKHHLENYIQEFRISGLEKGLYLICVSGASFQYAEKLLSNGGGNRKIKIERLSNNQITEAKTEKKETKGTRATVDMAYTAGDRLKFTGISGNYSTVMTDIPSSNKTFTFNFIACTDADNNNYPVVTIGTQTWMAENLKTTKYKNGTNISLLSSDANWGSPSTTAGYCWYNNDVGANKNVYGALYNAYAVNTGILCPTGWHVPSDNEWKTLEMSLGMTQVQADLLHASRGTDEGAKLKETGTAHWNSGTNLNSSGFTGLPGGTRNDFGSMNLRTSGYWWCSTIQDIYNNFNRQITSTNTIWRSFNFVTDGYSVRCVKD